MKLRQSVLEYIEQCKDEAFQLFVELARIPAPSGHEEKRAAFCKNWLNGQGAEGVYIDEVLNVIYPVNCAGNNSLAVYMAHSDIVFPDTGELPLSIRDGRVYCPGSGDDTANIAAMLMTMKYITEKKLKPKDGGILFIINSGEEGLGNLKGCRKIMKDYSSRISEFISFDGSNGKITNSAVGSKRFRVEITTEGGHAFSDFGNRNAIAYLASMINDLYNLRPPENGRTTYNTGTISGGTSVNTIAEQAEMMYEIRSENRNSLAEMEKHFMAAVEFYRSKDVVVNVELAGERPCMGDVDPARQQALNNRAEQAVRDHFNVEPEFKSGSTDCNIPFSIGIPSVALGCYFGKGSHTRGEYVETGSLLPGLKLAFDLVLDRFKE